MRMQRINVFYWLHAYMLLLSFLLRTITAYSVQVTTAQYAIKLIIITPPTRGEGSDPSHARSAETSHNRWHSSTRWTHWRHQGSAASLPAAPCPRENVCYVIFRNLKELKWIFIIFGKVSGRESWQITNTLWSFMEYFYLPSNPDSRSFT